MICWKGKCNSVEDLPQGELPENAVAFKEPKNTSTLTIIVTLLSLPIFVFSGVGFLLKYGTPPEINMLSLSLGAMIAFLMILPHELIHAITFPKGVTVDVWYIPKNLMAFVHSTDPMTKWQFIYMSLLPSLIFGFIPFILWLIIPLSMIGVSCFLFSFSICSLLMGVGDFMNVFNAFVQMPKGTYTQLSGFNSYWFYPRVQDELM